MVKTHQRLLPLLGLVTLSLLLAATASAQCSIQLSEQGVLHLKSGESRKVTWNSVPGATSYYTEDLIQSLGDPASPDFAFGAPYSESHNGEAQSLSSYLLVHQVLYKTTFRFAVTALNRSNPTWQPCRAEVTYVVDADANLASIASRRIVPLAGKANAMNGGSYSTALIVAGTGLGCTHRNPCNPAPDENLYQGNIYFRALGQPAGESDPSIAYALNGDETLVYDDVMGQLGASGLGTIEVIPKAGYPTPQVDAFLDSRLPNGQHSNVRIAAAWGRDHLDSGGTITVGIRNTDDTRLAVGVRSYTTFGRLHIEHLASDGTSIDTQDVNVDHSETTVLYQLQTLFPSIHAGDRFVIHFQGFNFDPASGTVQGGGAALVFLTETGNNLNVPNLLYRDPIDENHYSQGFDYFVVR
jgi:hypothetical protein